MISRYDEKPVVVIGGGISGITVAVEAAECGSPVVLLEKEPWLGGRVAGMHRYFPKLCAPMCGLEINFRRIKSNPKIEVFTLAEVESVSGSSGDFTLKVALNPRMINGDCTACGKCVDACPAERSDSHNCSLGKTKAVYMPHPMSFPQTFAIAGDACKGPECGMCARVCEYGAVNLSEQRRTVEIRAKSVVYATGWEPYDAGKIDNLGFGKFANVITNVMMERIAAPDGPTGGRIARPSDGRDAKNVAFAQCAGSRDEKHLPYCSAVCCLATLKQAMYVRESFPDSKVAVFYIDIRTPGKYEAFRKKASDDGNITFIKGKVANVGEDPQTKDVLISAEDVMAGTRREYRADMLVLATGMAPSALKWKGDGGPARPDEFGFISGQGVEGVFSAGVAKDLMDVSSSLMDATGVALKAGRGIRT